MNTDRAEQLLGSVSEHLWADASDLAEAKQAIAQAKTAAVAAGDQARSKLCWCWETVVRIQEKYLEAFSQMKESEFYQAWCALERTEIASGALSKHYYDAGDRFRTRSITVHVERFQSLYPYRMFLSPALVLKRCTCSICGSEISVRNPCGHRRGDIYDGEMCYRRVEEAEILELSLVPNPVQKYSVVFSKGDDGKSTDQYDYRLVEYVNRGLRSPFDEWDIEWTKIRHPHSLYEHYSHTDMCPCGSGSRYADCCVKEEGVLRPHARVMFAVPPPDDLQPIIYPVQEFR